MPLVFACSHCTQQILEAALHCQQVGVVHRDLQVSAAHTLVSAVVSRRQVLRELCALTLLRAKHSPSPAGTSGLCPSGRNTSRHQIETASDGALGCTDTPSFWTRSDTAGGHTVSQPVLYTQCDVSGHPHYGVH